MKNIAIAFVWNREDESVVQKYIDYSTSLLARNVENPFSRNIDLPIFYYSNNKGTCIPPNISSSGEKVIVYIFVGKNSVISEEWKDYIEMLVGNTTFHIIPIALDKSAFRIRAIESLNFIREYEYIEYKEQQFFVAMAHEIYRVGFSDEYGEASKKSALKIFLSHTKDKGIGENIAKQLKDIIDNSFFNRFFDTYDIAPGYRFDQEIINNIKEASLVILNSEKYSTRYWCQREVLISKEYERPIIEVNVIERGMDRKFPHAGNIPVIRVDACNGIIKTGDLYRILENILIETIRCRYADTKLLAFECPFDGMVKRMHRPPEMCDLKKIVDINDDKINLKYHTILYPDPPVYSEELDFFRQLGISVRTPIESQKHLTCSVGLSISNPDVTSIRKIGQNENHLKKLSQVLAKYLLGCSVRLVYGGDLRADGFTQNLILEARILQDKLQSKEIYLKNYISWPIYLEEIENLKTLWADNADILELIKVDIEKSVENLVVSKDKFLVPNTTNNRYVWSKSLTKMRKTMIEFCSAKICAGGRENGYKGKVPGVLEEICIASEMNKPLYLLGGFGGIVHSACEVIEGHDIPDNLTLKWQMENNSGYEELLQYYEDNGERVLYSKIVDNIKAINLNNGLSEEENIRLFHTPYVDEAVYLVLKGLQSIMQ